MPFYIVYNFSPPKKQLLEAFEQYRTFWLLWRHGRAKEHDLSFIAIRPCATHTTLPRRLQTTLILSMNQVLGEAKIGRSNNTEYIWWAFESLQLTPMTASIKTMKSTEQLIRKAHPHMKPTCFSAPYFPCVKVNFNY